MSSTGSGKFGMPWSRMHCAAVWINCVTVCGAVACAAPVCPGRGLAVATCGADGEPPHAASVATDITRGRASLITRVMLRG